MAKPQFKAVISTTKSSYKPEDEAELWFELTNLNEQDYYVLKWHTPFEGFRNNYLDVLRDGGVVPYRGVMVKRGNPSAECYLLIPAGSTAKASVKINEGYDVSMPGNYRVTLDTTLMDIKEKCKGKEFEPGKLSMGLNSVQLSADSISFVVEK